jgi:hypothetical protein
MASEEKNQKLEQNLYQSRKNLEQSDKELEQSDKDLGVAIDKVKNRETELTTLKNSKPVENTAEVQQLQKDKQKLIDDNLQLNKQMDAFTTEIQQLKTKDHWVTHAATKDLLNTIKREMDFTDKCRLFYQFVDALFKGCKYNDMGLDVIHEGFTTTILNKLLCKMDSDAYEPSLPNEAGPKAVATLKRKEKIRWGVPSTISETAMHRRVYYENPDKKGWFFRGRVNGTQNIGDIMKCKVDSDFHTELSVSSEDMYWVLV